VGPVEVVELRPEDRFQVEGQAWRALLISLSGSGPSPTRLTGGVDPPLRITAAWETVTIQAGEAAPVMLSGVHARIISELVQLGGPAPWEAVAGEIWSEDEDPRALRKRWDITLSRLRNRLREGKIRPDLVRAAGTGQIELVLRAGDVVEDRS
jgi:hypothetical protein